MPRGKRSGGAGRRKAVRVKTARGRSTSSTRWLRRQLNDPYVQEAKARGYRSRAAFKLEELNEKYRFLKRGGKVLDLGAAPGGWTQIAVDAVGDGGLVVAVDIQAVEPIPGAVHIEGDIYDEDMPERIARLSDGPFDVVLSDMAAPATGHAGTDHLRVMALIEAAYDVARHMLAPGGAFVAKVLAGGTERDMLDILKRDFAKIHHAKPGASRSDSREMYLVAIGFRGRDGA
ncbi:MAG: RlmE family RNA methyltransferase [Pseudomonadota bacterium]